MNKRGDEIVEAAIVLPIIILTILSLIMLIIYFYACLNSQIKLHKALINEIQNSNSVFQIINDSEETSKNIGGVISIFMSKEIEGRCYAIDEARLIRLGEVIDENIK